jgi:hypothetical protein
MAAPAFTLRQQNWGDDLRLPTAMETAEFADLFAAVDPIRKPSVPFQSKHLTALKRNTWYVLKRPADRSRSGLLCIWPARSACVYIGSGGGGPAAKPRVAIMRLRIDPQFFGADTGLTVFAATLSAGARKLWIEDVLAWKGRNVWAEETFSARWLLATQWLEHYCIAEPRLLGGLDVEVAPWAPLDSVTPEGVWELQGDQNGGQRRLLWIANHGPSDSAGGSDSPLKRSAAPKPAPEPAPAVITHVHDGGPLTAVATRDTTGPDQWALASSDGVSLGRALIRKLRISSELREIKGPSTRVHVVWVAQFNKWEIVGHSEAHASHSSFFEAAK